MTAQEKLTQYGNELKSRSNTGLSKWTAQEIIGKAATEGVCYRREGETRYNVKVTRQKKTITVTETKVEHIMKIVDGRGVFETAETSSVVMTIEL